VLETGEDLQDVLDKYPDELIGKTVARRFNHTKLPYLPKVLSIAKALPLQLHPVRSMTVHQCFIVLTVIPEQRSCIETA
jgi:mannose-6-phosphate isomerase